MPFRWTLRIAPRLVAAILALLLLLLFSLGLNVLREREFAAVAQRFANEDLERILLLTEINDHANDAARKLIVLLTAPREQRVTAYTEIDAANRRLDAAMLVLPRLIEGGVDNPYYKTVLDAIRRYRAAYQDTADLIEAQAMDDAARSVLETTDFELSMLVSATQNLDHTEKHLLIARIDALRQEQQADQRLLLAIGVVGLLLSAGLGTWIVRRVAMPLRGAARDARLIARGDYASASAVPARRDEVGDIARALRQMADAVRDREHSLQQMIDFDPLTGLAQRDRFVAHHQHQADAASVAWVVCFDLERLKSINALLGFDAGDSAIVAAARRIVDHVGEPMRAARLGGGTFVVWLGDAGAETTDALALRFQRAMEHQVSWNGHALDIGITMGLAAFGRHGDTVHEVIRRAEQALYEAKRLKLRRAVYSPTIEAERLSHLSLLTELQRSLAQGDVVPFLQPKLCLRTGRVTGAEALVRWRHPERGWIPPAEFIPFAERSGRIGMITRHMLRHVVTLLATELHGLSAAVNISTQDLADDGLVDEVRRLLADHGVEPGRLQLEVTESGLLEAGGDPVARLGALRAVGVQIAIDDFGTGQSSLAYLQRLPAKTLKIDRSFVHGVDADPARRTLLGTIVQLGHALGLDLVAEGIETEAELQLLRDMGCDQVQGYLVQRPLAVPDFLRWWAAQQLRDEPSDPPPSPARRAVQEH